MISQFNSKGSKLTIVFLLVILSYTFSLLWGWFPRTHSLIPLVVGWLAGIFICTKFFESRSFLYFFLYSIVLFLNVMSGDQLFHSTFSVFMEITWVLLPALITYGIINKGNDKIANATVIMILLMLIVNAVGSSFVEVVFPGSIRALFGESRVSGDATLQTYFFRYGLANYALPHAVPMIIPVLVMGLKSNIQKKQKLLLIVSLIACFVLVYLSGATGALITAIFAFLISLMTVKRMGVGRLILFVVLGVGLVFVLGNDELMLAMLEGLDELVGRESYFHSKILDFETLVMYDESSGDIGAREDLYMSTIYAIIESPLIGVNYKTGGHSVLLDRWGCLGLVGFLPFILFIITEIKKAISYIKKDNKVYYLEGVLAAFMIFTIKAIDRWEMWLFLFTVLPLLTHYIGNSENEET